MANQPMGRVGGVARSCSLRFCAALAGLTLAAVLPSTAVLGGAPAQVLEVVVEKAAAIALVPGGGADVRELRLLYEGKVPGQVGVYAARLRENAPSSSTLCRVSDPAAAFQLLITGGDDRLVYAGTLAGFAAEYRDPTRALPIPALGGRTAWDPGRASHIRVAVSLDPAADDAYMGCETSLELGWVAAGPLGDTGPDANSGRGLPSPAMPRSRRCLDPLPSANSTLIGRRDTRFRR
jgi:hypothetical protein